MYWLSLSITGLFNCKTPSTLPINTTLNRCFAGKHEASADLSTKRRPNENKKDVAWQIRLIGVVNVMQLH